MNGEIANIVLNGSVATVSYTFPATAAKEVEAYSIAGIGTVNFGPYVQGDFLNLGNLYADITYNDTTTALNVPWERLGEYGIYLRLTNHEMTGGGEVSGLATPVSTPTGLLGGWNGRYLSAYSMVGAAGALRTGKYVNIGQITVSPLDTKDYFPKPAEVARPEEGLTDDNDPYGFARIQQSLSEFLFAGDPPDLSNPASAAGYMAEVTGATFWENYPALIQERFASIYREMMNWVYLNNPMQNESVFQENVIEVARELRGLFEDLSFGAQYHDILTGAGVTFPPQIDGVSRGKDWTIWLSGDVKSIPTSGAINIGGVVTGGAIEGGVFLDLEVVNHWPTEGAIYGYLTKAGERVGEIHKGSARITLYANYVNNGGDIIPKGNVTDHGTTNLIITFSDPFTKEAYYTFPIQKAVTASRTPSSGNADSDKDGIPNYADKGRPHGETTAAKTGDPMARSLTLLWILLIASAAAMATAAAIIIRRRRRPPQRHSL
jgi:hypothetical protein